MLPILLGAVAGYLVLIPLGLVDLNPVNEAAILALPHLTHPSFSGELVGTAIFSIAIMAIATIPESTTHPYQISHYADKLANEKKLPKYHSINMSGLIS